MSHPAVDSRSDQGALQRLPSLEPEYSGLPLLVNPAEAARQLSLSRYTGSELVRSKRLRARRYGRILLIPRSELERFASTLGEK
jgi:excisionase family DNA binding protein